MKHILNLFWITLSSIFSYPIEADRGYDPNETVKSPGYFLTPLFHINEIVLLFQPKVGNIFFPLQPKELGMPKKYDVKIY